MASNPRPRRRGASARERPSARSSASATAISKAAAEHAGPPAELPKSWGTSAAVGSCPPRAALASRRRGTPRSAAACSTVIERRVDGGALGQRGALAPPLALLADDAHEEQRPHAVHAGGGADGLPERDVDPDQLDAGEPHGAGALPPRHRRSQLVRSGVPARMAEWQTRRPQKPLSERACGFESRSGHGALSMFPQVSCREQLTGGIAKAPLDHK